MLTKTKSKPLHYINGREFFEEMKIYHASYLESVRLGQEKPPATPAIANAILQINNRLSNLWNFSGYTYKSEMISDGILKCLDKVHRFDPNVSENAFAFFTQISFQSFVGRIKIEQHQSSVKAKLIREKMSSEFVQHGVDSDADNGENSFVEFLKSNDAYQDYHLERQDNTKKQVSDLLKHRNKTGYKKKDTVVVDKLAADDLTEFEEL
jgi:hypothetical protein